MINELREPEGHQLLLWHVCSHPDVGLLQPKSHRHWPRQPRACRNDDYCSHLGVGKVLSPSPAQGFSAFTVPQGLLGSLLKYRFLGLVQTSSPGLVLCL